MCISASVLFTAVCIGLVPNSYKTELDARAKLCESLAIQFCVGTQEKQIDIFNAFAPIIVKRDPDILSVAIRKTDGYLVAATDNHTFFWKDVSANRSTETHIQVPVFVNDERYGTIEVCFTALNSNWLIGSIREFHLPLILFMLVSEFIAFKLYLKKALRHLDPSSVIPGRVKQRSIIFRKVLLSRIVRIKLFWPMKHSHVSQVNPSCQFLEINCPHCRVLKRLQSERNLTFLGKKLLAREKQKRVYRLL